MSNIISDTCKNVACSSMQKWSIGNYVREILMLNEELKEYIGTDIFPLIAPEKTEGDFIIYKRTKYSKKSTKIGVYEDECYLALTVVSDKYDNALWLASEIDNTLTGRHTDGTFRFEMELVDSDEDYSDNKYIEVLLYQIK